MPVASRFSTRQGVSVFFGFFFFLFPTVPGTVLAKLDPLTKILQTKSLYIIYHVETLATWESSINILCL